eukprot:COSAG06_NODE_11838_length_1458_cov_1.231788_2_plen_177_part_01
MSIATVSPALARINTSSSRSRSLAYDILEAAPEALRDDDACVRAAVAQDGEALEHASERLRDDAAFVRALLEDADCTLLDKQDCKVSDALRADPELRAAAAAAAARRETQLAEVLAFAAGGAERLDRAGFGRLCRLLVDAGVAKGMGEEERQSEKWEEMWEGADAEPSQGLGLAQVQ